jgi:hypothetical protein
VSDGKDAFECFMFSRGDTAFALDFYSHNHEVVLWERKPDNDRYAGSQRWQFWWIDGANAYMIYNAKDKRCLTIDDAGAVGAHMHVSACDPTSSNQLWNWTDETSWILRSKLGTCVDIPRGEYSMGQTPFAYDCNGGPNQRWLMKPT